LDVGIVRVGKFCEQFLRAIDQLVEPVQSVHFYYLFRTGRWQRPPSTDILPNESKRNKCDAARGGVERRKAA
jgi:hypothetical protein